MAIAIGFSALNALTLSPALCAIFLKPKNEDKQPKSTFISRFHKSFNAHYDALLGKYKKRVLFLFTNLLLLFGAAS